VTVGVIADVRMGDVPVLVTSLFVLILFQQATAAKNDRAIVHTETLLRTSSSWDGEQILPTGPTGVVNTENHSRATYSTGMA